MPPKGACRKPVDSSDNTEHETHDEVPHSGHVVDTVNQFETQSGRPNPSKNSGIQQILDRLVKHQIESEERYRQQQLESVERIRQSEEKYRQQQKESEERIKQSQLEVEERFKKHKKEYDARIRLEKDEVEKRLLGVICVYKIKGFP
ncbi:hypothetical protein M5689_000741 [Euphorbia peplus]|nr:hypothetical protein M5689_000741 [Euphorbia peplus]